MYTLDRMRVRYDDVQYLELGHSDSFNKLPDDKAWEQIRELTGVGNASDFQKMDRETQGEALRELKEYGASIRQLERLTGIGRGLIQRM